MYRPIELENILQNGAKTAAFWIHRNFIGYTQKSSNFLEI